MYKLDEERRLEKIREGNQSFKRKSAVERAAAKALGLTMPDVAYKIKYTLNVLPSMLESEGRIIAALAGSEELEIFACPAVKELIQFKWESYAKNK